MIKPKELRQDNMVWFRPYSDETGHGQKAFVFVEEELRDGINLTEDKKTEYSALLLYGIHIMPEIMDQFNFFNRVEKGDVLHYFYEEGPLIIKFINSKNNWLRESIEIDGIKVNLSYCRFIHQLQNLYYALTGDDLELYFKSPLRCVLIYFFPNKFYQMIRIACVRKLS